MNRTYINELKQTLNQEILIQGFVENFRNSKNMAFIVLKDITGKVQITIEKEKHPDLSQALEQITPDSVISVWGVAVESAYVKLNGMEVIPNAIQVESVAEVLPIVREDIPATKKSPASICVSTTVG